MIFPSEAALLRTIGEFVAHDHGKRNHQGLDNELIEPAEHVRGGHGPVRCRERLGGMLRFYARQAA